MKRILAATLALTCMASAEAQNVPIYTADYYMVKPENYLGKEVTLAIAYVMPSERPPEEGLQAFLANTYNQNQWGGHILIAAQPAVASRVAAQCGTQHVYNHSHITFVQGVFMKEKQGGRYYVLVQK